MKTAETAPSQGTSRYLRAPPSGYEFLCGWGAGCMETMVLFPAHKIIFRQQLHGFLVVDALRQLRSEGLTYLYRGLLPPLMMRTSSRAVMFGLYDNFLHRLDCAPRDGQFVFSWCTSQAAFLAGACEASLCPLERIQVLMQTSKFHDHFKNTGDALVNIYRVYGIREYYRGLSVVIPRNGLSNILFFSLREPFKELIVDSNLHLPLPNRFVRILADFCSGAVLGASVSTLFFPLNVVKNRMQSQLGTPFHSPFRVFAILWHERQGWRELYRGVHLNGVRSLVGWGITNSVYEGLHRWITGTGTL